MQTTRNLGNAKVNVSNLEESVNVKFRGAGETWERERSAWQDCAAVQLLSDCGITCEILHHWQAGPPPPLHVVQQVGFRWRNTKKNGLTLTNANGKCDEAGKPKVRGRLVGNWFP